VGPTIAALVPVAPTSIASVTTVGTNPALNGTTTTTQPTDVIGSVVCLNATGDAFNGAVSGCQTSVGGGRSLTAGKVSEESFVMALDPVAHDDADRIAELLGFAVKPIDTSYLPDEVELEGTAADVVVVIGSLSPPHSSTTTTPVGP
jgi:hypothetical protein